MTRPARLAAFMLDQFHCSDDARDYLLNRAWTFERIGEVGRAWLYRQAAGLFGPEGANGRDNMA